jgi:hypothetical protein
MGFAEILYYIMAIAELSIYLHITYMLRRKAKKSLLYRTPAYLTIYVCTYMYILHIFLCIYLSKDDVK